MSEATKSVKTPPHSKESEMMVLGCMFSSVNAVNVSADRLADHDFYFSEHQIIFSVLQQFYAKDKAIDVHLVCEELKRVEKLDAVGGLSYLMTLAQYAGTSAHIEEYVQLVKSKAILRRMIHASQVIEKRAFEEPDEVQEALDEAQQLLFEIGQNAHSAVGVPIVDIIAGISTESKQPFLKALQERQELYQERGEEDLGITGVPTHLIDLDRMINGLNKSNLMILAGRPGMGKTFAMLNFAESVAFKNKIPVGIFSLEMSAEQLVHRMVCSQAEVESEKITKGSLNGMEFQRVVETVHMMEDHSLIIDDQPGLRITELRARARRMKENYDIGFLCIDYLQLLSGSGSNRSNESRQVEISEISRMLKNLARELNIPVLCLSQLSRKVEERSDHRPVMSDLRESGSIEQDSDLVLFLLRHEYYDPNNKPGMATMMVAKNRHGATGDVKLTFRKEIGQFSNYTPPQFEG